MNKTIQQKRIEFLEETVKYYSEDINRRCVSAAGRCLYDPTKAGKEHVSEGCAIGRKVSTELQIKLDDIGGISNCDAFEILPEELQELGQEFLIQIQDLHDFSKNWNELGLSEKGVEMVNIIKRDFCS